MAKKKIILGTLILIILTASFYILLPDKVRIDFQNTRTIFKVYEDGKFVISGKEYSRIFSGTTLLRAHSRDISYDLSEDFSRVVRSSLFKESIKIEDKYTFKNDVTDIESVPIDHQVCISNASGKIFEYLITHIEYDGVTKAITSPFSFGKNMKVTFQDGYYRAKVYQNKVAPDKLLVRYRVTSDYECFNVRLFDPSPTNKYLNLTLNNVNASRYYEFNTSVNLTAVTNNTDVCINVYDYPEYKTVCNTTGGSTTSSGSFTESFTSTTYINTTTTTANINDQQAGSAIIEYITINLPPAGDGAGLGYGFNGTDLMAIREGYSANRDIYYYTFNTTGGGNMFDSIALIDYVDDSIGLPGSGDIAWNGTAWFVAINHGNPDIEDSVRHITISSSNWNTVTEWNPIGGNGLLFGYEGIAFNYTSGSVTNVWTSNVSNFMTNSPSDMSVINSYVIPMGNCIDLTFDDTDVWCLDNLGSGNAQASKIAIIGGAFVQTLNVTGFTTSYVGFHGGIFYKEPYIFGSTNKVINKSGASINFYENRTEQVIESTNITTDTVDKATINISSATITNPSVSNIQTIEMSNDGGVTWESVTNGTEHTFSSSGNDLRYRINISTTNDQQSMSIEELEVSWSGTTSGVGAGNASVSYFYNITTLRIYRFTTFTSCYQEYANVSTSCGGLSNGEYNVEVNYGLTNGDSWNDGNYSSYDYGDIYYVNYTKPEDSKSISLWAIKHYYSSEFYYYNDTIPISCWNAYDNKIVLKYESQISQATDGAYCFDGSSWVNVSLPNVDSILALYEESMIWKIYNNSPISCNLNDSDYCYFTIDNRTDIVSIQFNLTGYDSSGYPENISIKNNGNKTLGFKGTLQDNYLNNTYFTYSGTEYQSKNLTFSGASSNTIYINMTENRTNLSLQLWGFDVDTGNSVDETDYFNDSSKTNTSLTQRMEVMGVYDNFNSSTGYWSNGGSYGSDSHGTYIEVYYSQYYYYGSFYDYTNNSLDPNFNLKKHKKFTFDSKNDITIGWDIHCSGAQSSTTYKIKVVDEDLDEVQIFSLSKQGVYGSTSNYQVNLTHTLYMLSNTSLRILSNGTDSGTGVQYDNTYSLSSLTDNQSFYLLYEVQVNKECTNYGYTVSDRARMYNLRESGLHLNRSNTSLYYSSNGTYVTSIIATSTTGEDFSGIYISGEDYEPSGTTITREYSGDNGANWIDGDAYYNTGTKLVFTNTGDYIMARYNMTTHNTNVTPIIYYEQIEVIPDSMPDLYIDLNGDGYDYSYNYTINSTTSPLNISFNNSVLHNLSSTYMFLGLSSTGSGLLQVNNLNAISYPNPVSLNTSSLESCETCNINLTFENGEVNLTDLRVDFLGEHNITVTANDSAGNIDTHVIKVKYSPFTCSFPFGIDYYEPIPMSNNDKNVSVLGQEINYCNGSLDSYCESSSIPIYNCTYLGYDTTMDTNLTMYQNDTQDGINMWFDDDINKTGGINLTTSEQYITQINYTEHSGIWTWVDFWNTSLESIYAFDPMINFKSYCAECVR